MLIKCPIPCALPLYFAGTVSYTLGADDERWKCLLALNDPRKGKPIRKPLQTCPSLALLLSPSYSPLPHLPSSPPDDRRDNAAPPSYFAF